MQETEYPPCIEWPASWVGQVDVSGGVLKIGDLEVGNVGSGYPAANVYVREVTGKRTLSGVIEQPVVGKILIEIIGDGFAQEELDEINRLAAEEDLPVSG